MPLATFCDLVWVEIYDDVSPMGDRAQYRRIVKELFLEGKDPSEIWIETTDAKGKKVRKPLAQASAESGPGGAIPRDALSEARRWRDRAIAAAEKARQQAEPDGTE
jgi:hypothetical protein